MKEKRTVIDIELDEDRIEWVETRAKEKDLTPSEVIEDVLWVGLCANYNAPSSKYYLGRWS